MAEEMSLEALEAEAAEALKADEVPPSTDPEEAAEGAAEASAETVAEEGASSEQAEHGGKKTVEIPAQKLAKLREQRREAREEQEKLRKQNEELQRLLSLSGGQKPVEAAPQAVPTLESCEYDETKYAQAMAQWHQQNLERQLGEMEAKRQQAQRQQAMQQQLEASMMGHYQRVTELGIAEDSYIPAEQTLRDAFGDLAVEQLIDAIGEGSERVIYHLGLNQSERDKLIQLVQQDPSGLKAVAYTTKLAAKLSTEPAQKKISQAPEADRPVAGGSTPNTGGAILKRLKQLDGMANRDQFREYKRKLIAAGQSDLLRQHGYM